MTNAWKIICGSCFLWGCSFQVLGLPDDFGTRSDLTVITLPDLFACVPGHTMCSGNNLKTCNSTGTGYFTTICAESCLADQEPERCSYIVPFGVAEAADFLDPEVQNFTVASDAIFNVDDGSISGSITRPAGPGVKAGISFRIAAQGNDQPFVAIFGFKSLNLESDQQISFVTNKALADSQAINAVALVAQGDITISGTLNGLGDCTTGRPGPGGYWGGPALAATGNGPGAGKLGSGPQNDASGGGGAGFGQIGGNGGKSSAGGGAKGGAAGQPYDPLRVSQPALVGGSGGSSGTGNADRAGAGGSGGGAMQITANGKLSIYGSVTAGGCGGAAGKMGAGGGGGGSGGLLVLEGSQIIVGAIMTLAANGGGGGGADVTPNPLTPFAGYGEGGLISIRKAAGGVAGAGGTGGGPGGAANSCSGATASDATSTMRNSGGGGGACGRILLRNLTGQVNWKGVISPSLSDVDGKDNKLVKLDTVTYE